MGVLGPLLPLPDGAPVTTDPWLDFLKKLRLDPGTLPCSGDENGLCAMIATLPSRCACGAWSYGWQCAEHVQAGHCMRCQRELEEARQRVAEKIAARPE